MRKLGLIVLAGVILALTVLITAWPALQELRRAKNWNVIRTKNQEGDLAGVRVSLDAGQAMIFPADPSRAILYLRLGLQGDRDTLNQWLICDIGLTDSQGRKWLPLTNTLGLEVIKLLGDADGSGQSCGQSLVKVPEDGSPSYSVQAFLVPVEVLDDLRVEISSITTRPNALSLPFRPELRPPPT